MRMNPGRGTNLVIVGGGIVGLACAWALSARPPGGRLHITLLEKESRPACHQSGRNSGVIHSGVYYPAASLKAHTCRSGKALLERFCAAYGIPHVQCGKLIVAVNAGERGALTELQRRGRANGVECRVIGPEAMRELEPHARGCAALHVPEAGIVDYTEVAARLAALLRERGHRIEYGQEVLAVYPRKAGFVLQTAECEYPADFLLNCAGLQADRIARMCGEKPPVQIIPFRGEYYSLRPAARHLCRGLIYPVPDARFPFLGVHVSKTIHGGVECGPNALLAPGREAYSKREFNSRDLAEIFGHRGFRKLARRYWQTGLREWLRSTGAKAFARSVQRLVPAIEAEDLLPRAAGIRAQAVDIHGTLVDDFLLLESKHSLHVLNAPSPAATAALAIGRHIAGRSLRQIPA